MINHKEISARVFSNTEDQQKLTNYFDSGIFSFGKAAMVNLSKDDNWVGSSCYLVNTKGKMSAVIRGFLEGAINGGSTGINVTNLSSESILTLIRSAETTISLLNQEQGRPGAGNIIVPCYSDAVDKISKCCETHATDGLKVATVTIGLNFHFILCAILNQSVKVFDLSDERVHKTLTGKYGKKYIQAYNELCLDSSIRSRSINPRNVLRDCIHTASYCKSPMFVDLDNCALLSPQKTILDKHPDAVISLNICLEVVQFTLEDLFAVCHVGSISLPKYVLSGDRDLPLIKRFDFVRFGKDVEFFQRSLTSLSRNGTFEAEEYARAAKYYCANALGVTGFHELLIDMDLQIFEKKIKFPEGVIYTNKISSEVTRFNKLLCACMYYHSVNSSNKQVISGEYPRCEAVTTYDQGLFRFDLVNELYKEKKDILTKMIPGDHTKQLIDELLVKPESVPDPSEWGENSLSWKDLKSSVKKHGLANSLLHGQMPTSTASRLRNESAMFEFMYSNLYDQKSYQGVKVNKNKRLKQKCIELGIDCGKVFDYARNNHGSIAGVGRLFPEFEEPLKEIEANFRTIWEVDQQELYRLTVDRNMYFDQNISQNYYVGDRTNALSRIYSAVVYSSLNGLGNNLYYLSTRKEDEKAHVCLGCDT